MDGGITAIKSERCLKIIRRISNSTRGRTGNQGDMTKLRRPVNKPTIMDKSLGTLLHFWAFSNSHRPNPRIFCTRIGWGEGELQENFEKDELFYERTQNDRKI